MWTMHALAVDTLHLRKSRQALLTYVQSVVGKMMRCSSIILVMKVAQIRSAWIRPEKIFQPLALLIRKALGLYVSLCQKKCLFNYV